MEDLKKDSRFSHIPKDPRFRTVPSHERKVKVDKRFQGMFKDKRFKVKYQVDKRGRPINRTSKEDLRRFYEMSSSDSEEDSEEDVQMEKSKRTEKKKSSKNKAESRTEMEAQNKSRDETGMTSKITKSSERTAQKISDSDIPDQDQESHLESSGDETESESGSDSGLDQPGREDLLKVRKLESDSREGGEEEDDDEEEDDTGDDESDDDDSSDNEDEGPKVDLARGEGNMETSSSDSELEFDEEESEHEWGELDKSAPTTDKPTCRFAVCNMDWDRIKAVDLLVVFNSFKPTGGVVKSVKIFPSEYGGKRLQEEDLQGPAELLGGDDNHEEENETEQGSKYSTERLRRYQLNRLKYYYAVVECDSVQTSAAIYKQCDGIEFELSAARMDLRFIPDDMTFDDQKPTQVATDVPPTYNPSVFFNTALQQTSVELTWDETNKERLNVTMRKFKEEDIDKLDLTEYLASSSGEEDAGLANLIGASSDEEEKEEEEEEEMKDEDQIAKYRALLLGLDKKEEKTEFEKDMEMEVTWEPGLREKAEDLVKKKTEDKKSTPWQQYLEKKKQKKRERKQELKKIQEERKFEEVEESGEEDLPAGVDLGDEYFKEELEKLQTDDKSKKRKKRERKKVEEPTPEEEKQKAELELLMMDGEDNKRHFNMKDIIEAETQADEKKKGKKKKDRNTTEKQGTKLEDNFEIDVQDPRFEAVYSSHLYNIDPSDPGYKKTKAMDAILTEKQHRRAKGKKRKVPTEKKVDPAKEQTKSQEASLDMLVKSVKAKTSQFQARKKMKSS
ncbi:ESF1 homolog [Branchiostoma floridae]|uniref:ESF1 homolog n=1 Tax=Branchiostoma floridae TaxID=7739 RepID=A0A9J7LP63_BRAFL|nr:ESF1 homolog [Branchiostoma floridae]XP_035685410.1 ESF1 homolog [Branchiostoma floridae]